MSRRSRLLGTLHRWAVAAVVLCVQALIIGPTVPGGPVQHTWLRGAPVAGAVARTSAEPLPVVDVNVTQAPPGSRGPVSMPEPVPRYQPSASGRHAVAPAVPGVRGEPFPPRSQGLSVVRVPRAPPAARR